MNSESQRGSGSLPETTCGFASLRLQMPSGLTDALRALRVCNIQFHTQAKKKPHFNESSEELSFQKITCSIPLLLWRQGGRVQLLQVLPMQISLLVDGFQNHSIKVQSYLELHKMLNQTTHYEPINGKLAPGIFQMLRAG